MRRRSRVVADLIVVMRKLALKDPKRLRRLMAEFRASLRGVDKKSTN